MEELEAVKKEKFLRELQELFDKHGYMLYPVLQVMKSPKIEETILKNGKPRNT